MIKISINLLCLFFLCGCKEIRSNQNKYAVEEENTYPKHLQLEIDSVRLYNRINQLKIWGTLINDSEKIHFLPIIEKNPLVSASGIDWEVVDSMSITGLYIQWFKGDSLVRPNNAVLPPSHYPPPFPGETFSWEDSIRAYSGRKRGWEVKNIIEVEKLKKKGKDFKTSYNWYYRHKEMVVDNPFILQPKSTKKLQVLIDLNKLTENFHNRFSYELDDFIKNIDSVELKIISDTVMLKDSILLKSDLVKFKKKGIHIFDGVVKSNKAKLIKK